MYDVPTTLSEQLGHYGEAEEALREANLLDSTCGETWAYISLASLLSDQRVLAEQAYKYALKVSTQLRVLWEQCGTGTVRLVCLRTTGVGHTENFHNNVTSSQKSKSDVF